MIDNKKGMEMDIEDMSMGKFSDKVKGKMPMSEVCKKHLAYAAGIQNKLDKISPSTFDKFDVNELDKLEDAHEKLAKSHRRIANMISDRLHDEEDKPSMMS